MPHNQSPQPGRPLSAASDKNGEDRAQLAPGPLPGVESRGKNFEASQPGGSPGSVSSTQSGHRADGSSSSETPPSGGSLPRVGDVSPEGTPSPLSSGPAWFPTSLFFNEPPVLRAFRHGVMLVMPLLLAAALALLVNNFPLLAYQNFMLDTFGESWKHPGSLLYNSTIEILALATCLSISTSMINMHNEQHTGDIVLPAIGSVTALSCLFIIMGPEVSAGGLFLPWAGIRGLFGALVITVCSCVLLLRLCRIKQLRMPFYSEGIDPILPNIFGTLLPVILTLLIFVLLRELLFLAGVESLHQAMYDALRAPFHDAMDSFGLGTLYAFLVQLCWFVGIHGTDLLDPITHQVLIKGMEANSFALNHQLPPPHIFTKYFYDVYVYIGGSGATLGLLLAIFLNSKDNGAKRIAGISIIPGIFNINELLIFGLPVVLNPAFLIPFLLAPLVLLVIAYLAVLAGIAPLPVYHIDWTTPPIINAYISTKSWQGVAMQIVNLIIATLIYIPFIRIADKAKVASRREAFVDLVNIAASNTRGLGGKRCTDRPDSAGALARALSNDMLRSLENDDGVIRLHYQPRVDLVSKTVPCVEALLRWVHPLYGPIPPSLTLAIAEDNKLTQRIDSRIMQLAFEQQHAWRKDNIITAVSINLSEEQLQDPQFPSTLQELFIQHNLPPDSILLEVRESLALDPEARYLPALEALHALGVRIAVDDFGRGYQAISHVKRLPLAELQIDRALIKNVVNNTSSQDVISTIQELCFTMGVKTSAEYIENRDQLETLLELNFSTFQGYYFSEPVDALACGEFIRNFPVMPFLPPDPKEGE